MTGTLQSVRGMNDILPAATARWQQVEDAARRACSAYGYSEIRLPLVEHTELFARAIGEVTDIVEKEMYTFDDRNGESLTLRPEGTAGCVRAAISNGMLHNQTQRLWYAGPMFRHERPQKGRYRQFYQIGAEAFGFDGPDIDAELIALAARLLRSLGVDDLSLQLNSLGTPDARAAYRERLVEYFSAHESALDDDSKRRLSRSPLRILDSKHPGIQELVAGAPVLMDYLDDESRRHFDQLQQLLDDVGIPVTLNPRLVRGLDYYSRTVFEWTSNRLGAQDAVCSGGRYDGLVELLGGRPTPAVGWALGVERLVALVDDGGLALPDTNPHAYVVAVGDAAVRGAFSMVERLRGRLPGLRVTLHCGDGSFKSQLKRADKSGAKVALVIGEAEHAAGTVGIKALREEGVQESVVVDGLADALLARFGEELL